MARLVIAFGRVKADADDHIWLLQCSRRFELAAIKIKRDVKIIGSEM